MGDEWPLSGRGQGHVTYFKFWDPLRNVWTSEARHFVFSFLDRSRRVLSKGRCMTPMGAWSVVRVTWRDLVFKFWDPLRNFWTGEARNFSFVLYELYKYWILPCMLAYVHFSYPCSIIELYIDYRMVIFFWYYLVRGTHWVIGTAWSSA